MNNFHITLIILVNISNQFDIIRVTDIIQLINIIMYLN